MVERNQDNPSTLLSLEAHQEGVIYYIIRKGGRSSREARVEQSGRTERENKNAL